jgi:probable HAF family extracellular repeat protein
MLRSRAPILALACTVAACTVAACTDPTAPPPPTRPDPEPRPALVGQGYTVSPLPLIPAGINDAGVIAGNLGGNAARFHSGVLTTLPRVPGLYGTYVARAINSLGGIVGHVVSERGLFWPSPTGAPIQILPNNGTTGPVLPLAVNRAGAVVGSFNAYGNVHAFRWTPNGPFLDITPAGFVLAVAFDVNEAGYAVGYGWKSDNVLRALRWAPNAGAAAVILGVGQATVIRNNGDAAGTNQLFTTTLRWPFSGGVVSLPGPQVSAVEDISENGRIVGHTYRASPINPHRPWTNYNGSTLWLPVPNTGHTDAVDGLRVNRCGTIVGTQTFTTGSRVGLRWDRSFTCDIGDVVTQP